MPTISLAFLAIAGCGGEESVRITKQEIQETTGTQRSGPSDAPAAADVKNAVATGAVTETMDAAGYTYIQVDTGDEMVWAAAPKFKVKVGDEVVVPAGTPMTDFHSDSLDRDFELVHFVESVSAADGSSLTPSSQRPAGHPPMAGSTAAKTEVDVSGITKAEGGNTIGEVFAGKAELAGQEVTVRGKVVKFLTGIMGKNWLHLQDGSGEAAARTNDLTVTTDATVKIGDTVLVNGTLVTDKDFGFGYKYDVIIEDAKVTIE